MTTLWHQLGVHASATSQTRTADLFSQDPQRFDKLSRHLDGLLADFSKNNIDDRALDLLLALADEKNLCAARDAMFDGKPINTTENRAVLHTALRSGKNTEVQDILSRMADFAEDLRSGTMCGHTGKPFTDIVNIGIGGSYLGPEAVALALEEYRHPHLKLHFVSNVEASALHYALRDLPLETTLFVVASKTFTTAETMLNARIARDALLSRFGNASDVVDRHFIALSTNTEAAAQFGISASRVFPFHDWVGGRFSVWSAIGLPVMMLIGAAHFQDFLAGARRADHHFASAPLRDNIPVLMGLIGIWQRNFCGYAAQACIPYHAGLRRLPAWLQQLDMESNGKHAAHKTGSVIFGEPGTDAQHSFFQWLHQGTDIVPIDFIGFVKNNCGNAEQQRVLLANLLAQAEALMTGRPNASEPHRHFAGNRPSTMLLFDALTPYNLGMLMALYEHKVFVQGVIWGINSFDQWGVELGKVMAKTIEGELAAQSTGHHDASTTALMQYISAVGS